MYLYHAYLESYFVACTSIFWSVEVQVFLLLVTRLHMVVNGVRSNYKSNKTDYSEIHRRTNIINATFYCVNYSVRCLEALWLNLRHLSSIYTPKIGFLYHTIHHFCSITQCTSLACTRERQSFNPFLTQNAWTPQSKS